MEQIRSIRSLPPRTPPPRPSELDEDAMRNKRKRKQPMSARDVAEAFDRKRKRARSRSPSPPPPLLAKDVAKAILERHSRAAEESPEKALRCCCRQLPWGHHCALHQHSHHQSWMFGQGGFPFFGLDAEVVLPKSNGRGSQDFADYLRWRSRIWTPTRFYLEHAKETAAARLLL